VAVGAHQRGDLAMAPDRPLLGVLAASASIESIRGAGHGPFVMRSTPPSR
jgi:hypothetical protein